MFSMLVSCDTDMLASLIPLCHEIDTSHVPFFNVINDYHPIFPRIFPSLESLRQSRHCPGHSSFRGFTATCPSIWVHTSHAFLSASDLLLIINIPYISF